MDIRDSKNDFSDLKKAVALLESPSITARISNLIGSPLEAAVKVLPKKVQKKIHSVVEAALFKSAQAALWTMDNTPHSQASTKWHKVLAATSGAAGGLFGLPALAIELPLSTTIMMRAVADVGRSEGFDLDDLATKQACIEVFALGGESSDDDGTESGYYMVRGFMTEAVQQMGKVLAEVAAEVAAKSGSKLAFNFTSSQAGGILAKLIEAVATRFSVVITEKVAAQAVPVVGAVAGAGINALFTNFYQDMARGHFIVKRLEEKYGEDNIRTAYAEILRKSRGKGSKRTQGKHERDD